MVAWAASANLKRVGRVDAVYDYRGLLQQTIAYQEVNDAGEGVLDGKQVLTRYVYDQAGRLLSKVSPTDGATLYTYDGLGRVLSAQDAAGNVSLTQYDDVGNRVVLTQANGLKSVSTYDTVSYTHLDVYKRQSLFILKSTSGACRYGYATRRSIVTRPCTWPPPWPRRHRRAGKASFPCISTAAR